MSVNVFGNLPSPLLVIVAGPNGSGKTTLSRDLFPDPDETDMVWLNADELVQYLRETDSDIENIPLHAAKTIDGMLDECIENRESVLVETVLSSGKYQSRVKRAKELGFYVLFVFVTLDRPELNIERVAQRVRESGHDVPEEKIRSRYHKSIAEATGFFGVEAHLTIFMDNTSSPVELLRVVDGYITIKDKKRCEEIIPGFEPFAAKFRQKTLVRRK
ncbi:MAG: zeta toxin family protein [Rhodospirillales bacterium]